MISKAKARFVRTSARKIRYVIDLIRGKDIPAAFAILANLNKRAASYVNKVLKSAVANAKKVPNIKEENLYIAKIVADGGPMWKRYRAAAMGRATMIRKRTSHIYVELDTKKERNKI